MKATTLAKTIIRALAEYGDRKVVRDDGAEIKRFVPVGDRFVVSSRQVGERFLYLPGQGVRISPGDLVRYRDDVVKVIEVFPHEGWVAVDGDAPDVSMRCADGDAVWPIRLNAAILKANGWRCQRSGHLTCNGFRLTPQEHGYLYEEQDRAVVYVHDLQHLLRENAMDDTLNVSIDDVEEVGDRARDLRAESRDAQIYGDFMCRELRDLHRYYVDTPHMLVTDEEGRVLARLGYDGEGHFRLLCDLCYNSEQMNQESVKLKY